jgi:multiple sugar transport system substrate-binding protein
MEPDFKAEVWTEIGWDPLVAKEYVDTLAEMEASTNRVFPLRVPGTFEFNSALATGAAKALAGQLSPQAALDEVATEWKAILERVGVDNVRDAYAIGVGMEDNQL